MNSELNVLMYLRATCDFSLPRYDGLFRFLLLLRRAQIALQQIWALLMQYRRKAEELRPVWELRTHMGFLIDNLQYYVQVFVCVCVCVCVRAFMHVCVCVIMYSIIQVDVLEAQFSQLVEKIQSTHDFESIKHAHESFVTTLQSQLFFTMPSVSPALLNRHPEFKYHIFDTYKSLVPSNTCLCSS